MLYLLNPRVLIALAIVAVLAFTHITAYRKGSSHVRNEWAVSVANANAEARDLERQRQRRADEAASLAAARETRNRAAAVRAASAAVSLRNTVSTLPSCGDPGPATVNTAREVGELLSQCGEALTSMAAEADRASSEALMLRQAWPR